jgi:cytochrome c-type biogenesis protein CcmH/NrfF
VWVSGPDRLLWVDCLLVVLLGGVSIWAFRRLAEARSKVSLQEVGFADSERSAEGRDLR